MSRSFMVTGLAFALAGGAALRGAHPPGAVPEAKVVAKAPRAPDVDIRSENGEIFIAAEQIRAYDWAIHTLTLAPKVREQLAAQLRKRRGLIPGIPFVVAVGGKAVYGGKFTTVNSSASVSTVVIVVDAPVLELNLSTDQLRIELGYPGVNFFRGEDPRGDERIRAALRASGKLAATLTPEQQRAVAALAKLGGKVEAIENGACNVTLRGGDFTDADLTHVLALPRVAALDLTFVAGVTDAGIARLTGLADLRSLSLVGTRVGDEGMKAVATLTGLRRLDLPAQVTDTGLGCLKSLTKLEDLGLGETRITDAGLAHLKGMTTLRALNFMGLRSRPDITDAGLAHLAELTELRTLLLAGTITDDGLKHLAGLKELRTLNLDRTRVTDAGLTRLQALVTLEKLHLPGSITDRGLAALAPLHNLRELTHIPDGVTDAGLAHLKGLKELRVLHFWYAPVSGAGLKHLTGLKNLHTVQLWNVPLTDADLEPLQALAGLEHLSLKGSKVTDRGVVHLQPLTQLKELDLRETGMTRAGAAALRQALPKANVLHRD